MGPGSKPFEPTDEQRRIIEHAGSAFIAACPGAGKTRVIVERARRLLGNRPAGRGIAFLSFTTAAVSELEMDIGASRRSVRGENTGPDGCRRRQRSLMKPTFPES